MAKKTFSKIATVIEYYHNFPPKISSNKYRKLKVPNATTIQAMKEAEQNIGETISFEEFLEESQAQTSP